MLTSQSTSLRTINLVNDGHGFISLTRHDQNRLLQRRCSVGRTLCQPPTKIIWQREMPMEKDEEGPVQWTWRWKTRVVTMQDQSDRLMYINTVGLTSAISDNGCTALQRAGLSSIRHQRLPFLGTHRVTSFPRVK
jgi:hypothetical protein